jgi:diadenylate cyclase
VQIFLSTLRNLDLRQALLGLLDILVVAYLLYRLLMLARGRRAWQILIGIGVFFGLLWVSDRIGLITLNWLLRQVTPLGPVAVVILLYPELREVLERWGHLDFWGGSLVRPSRQANVAETVEAVVTAATLLSARKTGALIVLSRETGLDDVIATGTRLDAVVTSELLTTLFYSGTALHDGAAVLHDGRIVAAGCTLPLTTEPNVASNVHMRHRAAMGVTETTDALVVIVSEETGTISLAGGGKLQQRGFKPEALRERLMAAFGKAPKERGTVRIPFRRKSAPEEKP